MTFSRDTRTGDRVTDVIELVKAGMAVARVRTFLAEHASELAVLFDALVARARAEEPSV